MSEYPAKSVSLDESKITAALRQAADSRELPVRFRQPSAAVMLAGGRQWKLSRFGAVAAAVIIILLTTRLTVMAQGGISWPWHQQQPPRDTDTGAAAQATAADTLALAEHVRSAEANAPAVRELSLSNPVRPANVVDPFGTRKHPTQPLFSQHTGTDFSARVGDPVYAAADGVVTAAESFPALGNVVVITHGKLNEAPVSTWYAHNSQLQVAVGQQVKRGDVIALAGATGAVTGPHLHFEVRVNGQPVDPKMWLLP